VRYKGLLFASPVTEISHPSYAVRPFALVIDHLCTIKVLQRPQLDKSRKSCVEMATLSENSRKAVTLLSLQAFFRLLLPCTQRQPQGLSQSHG
jgi:hypothetical protein